jgi:hypothetical protein
LDLGWLGAVVLALAVVAVGFGTAVLVGHRLRGRRRRPPEPPAAATPEPGSGDTGAG